MACEKQIVKEYFFFCFLRRRGVWIIISDLQTLRTVCVAPSGKSRFCEDLRNSPACSPNCFHLACPLRGPRYKGLHGPQASTWAVAEHSCDFSGAVGLFTWPELLTSAQPRSPYSSARSRWRRGAAAPHLATSLRAGGSGRGACRRPAEPPARSDPLASTDTRPLCVCPVRSPWARACGPATRTLIRPAGVLQRWFRRWTGSWGEWHDGRPGPEPQVRRGVSSAGKSAPLWAAPGAAVAVLPYCFMFLQRVLTLLNLRYPH